MHELSRGLGISWLDDNGPSHIAECYSGSFCVGQFGVGGGSDETPEEVILGGNTQDDWSLMAPTNDPVPTVNDMYGYSIEELLTIDFEDIPSIDD